MFEQKRIPQEDVWKTLGQRMETWAPAERINEFAESHGSGATSQGWCTFNISTLDTAWNVTSTLPVQSGTKWTFFSARVNITPAWREIVDVTQTPPGEKLPGRRSSSQEKVVVFMFSSSTVYHSLQNNMHNFYVYHQQPPHPYADIQAHRNTRGQHTCPPPPPRSQNTRTCCDSLKLHWHFLISGDEIQNALENGGTTDDCLEVAKGHVTSLVMRMNGLTRFSLSLPTSLSKACFLILFDGLEHVRVTTLSQCFAVPGGRFQNSKRLRATP